MFEKLKVIELASVLAAPSVGQFFAELGAEVIKIENPKTNGDVTRSWKLPNENVESNFSAYFSAVNWGKKSLFMDISENENLQNLYQLIQTADIVLVSYKFGDAEKLKVDYKTLQKINPNIIYGHITGYGTDNPKVGYDAIIQAETGFLYMNGHADGLPHKMPVALVDVLAAHQLKEGILIALLKRMYTPARSTGAPISVHTGAYVSVSLFDAAVSALTNQATNWLNAGHSPQRMGNEHPNIVPYGTIFTTKDDKMLILAVGTDKQFISLCNILNINEIPKNENFSTNAQRVRNRLILVPILEQEIKKYEKKHLLEKFEEKNVPAGGVNDVSEVFEMPQAQELLLNYPKNENDNNDGSNFVGLRQFIGKII